MPWVWKRIIGECLGGGEGKWLHHIIILKRKGENTIKEIMWLN